MGSLKNVSCLRSPSGVFTWCSCGTLPKRVAMIIVRCVGCQVQKSALRDSAYRFRDAATDAGMGGMPSITRLVPAVMVSGFAGAVCATETWQETKKKRSSVLIYDSYCVTGSSVAL